jgi:hypothetical protein
LTRCQRAAVGLVALFIPTKYSFFIHRQLQTSRDEIHLAPRDE